MRYAFVLAALLLLGTGPAFAATPSGADGCDNAIGGVFCLVDTLLFGPNGVVPFTTNNANNAAAYVEHVLPMVLGGLA